MGRGEPDIERAGTGGRRLQTGLVLSVWGLLAALALWRVVLTGTTGMVVHWRRLDDFAAWLAIGILALGMEGGVFAKTVAQRRRGQLLAALMVVGMALTGVSLALDQLNELVEASAGIAFAGWVVLGVCAAVLSLNELRSVLAMQKSASSRGPSSAKQGVAKRGVTILDLWRFAAAQWGLLMVSAVLFVAATMRKEERLGTEAVRNLLFLVPAAGVLPNAMMAAGIAWWDQILRSDGKVVPVPRVRAWLAAFVLLNAGALLLVTRVTWLGIPGALLQGVAIGMYLLGFPGGFWRGIGGKAVLVAWGLLALALGALVIERVMLLGNQPAAALRFFSGAWRHVWTGGAVTLWLLGMGSLAMERVLPERLRVQGAVTLALMLTLIGSVLIAGVWLTAQTQWILLGTLPAAVGMAVAGAVLGRVVRAGRRVGDKG